MLMQREKKTDGGYTALHHAVTHNQKEIAGLLISRGADVHVKQNVGMTPLFGASKEMTHLLINAGADVNAQDDTLDAPLLHAMMLGLKETAKLLVSNGADINIKGFNGRTPLFQAVTRPNNAIVNDIERSSKEMTEFIIAAGADVNAQNGDGKTPLDFTTDGFFADEEIAELLRKRGGKTAEELKAEEK